MQIGRSATKECDIGRMPNAFRIFGSLSDGDDTVRDTELRVFNLDRWYHQLPGNKWHPDPSKRFGLLSMNQSNKERSQ